MRLQQQKQKRQAMEAKYETKKVMSAQKQEEKRREELQKRRQMTRKKMECDERRKQEEEARLRKIKEQVGVVVLYTSQSIQICLCAEKT